MISKAVPSSAPFAEDESLSFPGPRHASSLSQHRQEFPFSVQVPDLDEPTDKPIADEDHRHSSPPAIFFSKSHSQFGLSIKLNLGESDTQAFE